LEESSGQRGARILQIETSGQRASRWRSTTRRLFPRPSDADEYQWRYCFCTVWAKSYLKLQMVNPIKPRLGWIPSRTFKSGIWILGTVRHPGSAASGLLRSAVRDTPL